MSNAASPISPALEFLSGFSNSSSACRINEGDNVDDFIIGSVLSSGSSALVRNAKHLPSSTAVAVRIVYQSNNQEIRTEINRWLSLNHKNILPLLHFSESSNFLLTFSPICSTTLLNYLNKYHSTGMSVHKTHNTFRQLAAGVRYLHHRCSLVHRDLKLENILLDNAGNWVISDFGLSQTLEETASLGDTGSLPYASPELIKPPTEQLSTTERFNLLKKADVWALGCILYALLSGKLPFSDAFVPRLQMKILGGNYKRLNSNSRSRERSNTRSRSRSRVRGTDEADELAAMGVLEMCLNPVTDLRPFIEDILDTEWVANGLATHPLEPSTRRMRSRSSSRNRSSRSRSRSRARNAIATPMSHLSPVNEQVNGGSADEERERGRPTIKRGLAN